MRKAIRICAAISAAFGMQFVASTGALADPETGIADFIDDVCKPAVEAGTFETVGQCMGESRQDLVRYCKDNYEALGFKNHGGCEKWAQDQIKNNDY